MFPFTIQSDIIANRVSDIVMPTSGRTFGCRRNFHITTSLQNLCMTLSVGLRAGEATSGNSRQLSFQDHCSSTSSEPSPQPPGHHVPPSIRPQTHPCTMRHVCGHSTQGFSRLLEEWHGGHTPYTTTVGISSAPIPGYLANPAPSWQSASMSISISMNRWKTCLVYHVDEGLCVISTEGIDCIAFIPLRGDRFH